MLGNLKRRCRERSRCRQREVDRTSRQQHQACTDKYMAIYLIGLLTVLQIHTRVSQALEQLCPSSQLSTLGLVVDVFCFLVL